MILIKTSINNRECQLVLLNNYEFDPKVDTDSTSWFTESDQAWNNEIYFFLFSFLISYPELRLLTF